MQTRRVVRADQWWDSKVPPLVGVGALAIGARSGPAPADALGDLVLLLCSVIGVAAFGHVLNDWCDIEADAAGEKANRVENLGAGLRAGLAGGALVVGLVPWFFLDQGRGAVVALGAEVFLLVAYSVPPLRLKGRVWAGALADAGYAFAVPFILVVLVLGPRPGPSNGAPLLVALGAWGLVLGLRGILRHQLDDVEADRAAGIGTVARSLGVGAVERLLASVLLPLELVLLVAVVVLAGITWIWWLIAVFVLWRTFQVSFLWTEPLVPSVLRQPRQRVEVVGFEYVNDFLERWLPLAALVSVAWSSPWWWFAVVVHLVVFRTAVRTFFGWDMWVLPDGLERLAYARKATRDIAEVARQREDRLAAGPVPLTEPASRRWVFVVCGPRSHIETLSTALRHLRPVTEAEIWVVTDASRNAVPIEVPGIDRLVDVAAPDELDDHQASIWLKTSVYRHLPVGEWCYLDSDIVAVAPAVEEVFDHRNGPVAFASDLTVRENSVDRFSPWAMTCECLGYDDQHSCGHLRQQLADRFGIDVPGGWLHWNGGVFVFGPEAAPLLDLWHERAVASFAWPEWKTRDQGALIASVWSLGLQDLPRLPATFNFIADLGNHDLCLDPQRGWAHHPSGPWFHARMLHLYTSALEDPTWNLGRDVEAVVLRRSRVRVHRYRRSQVQDRLELWGLRARRFPRRLVPSRIWHGLRVRLGLVRSVPGGHLTASRPQRAESDPP